MPTLLAVFAALLPVFLVIVLGHLLRLRLLPDEAHWIGLERLTYYVLFPALIIETLARADLGAVPAFGVGASLFLAILLLTAFSLLIRPALTSRIGLDGPGFTSLVQGAIRWNTFVALGVAGSLYGEAGITLAAVAMVAMIPVLNVISVWVLAHFAAGKEPDARSILAALLRNPLIWSCIVGMLLNALDPPLPQPLVAFADMLGRASIVLGLLAVGSGLKLAGLHRPHAATLIATFVKLVANPAIAITLGLLFGLSGASLAVVACASSVPSATNAYVLARQMGGDAPLMAQILTWQTLLAVVTMPVVMALVP